MAAAERRALKAGVWTIRREEREQPTGRCEHLGESLLNIANQLRGLEDGADALRWVANSLSTELYKVLYRGMKDKPLLDCLSSPTMPMLDSALLRGDAHELYTPIEISISPPIDNKVGTGLSLSVAAHIYPLHGLSKVNGSFVAQPPWNEKTPHMPSAEWVGQELVQACYVRRTILDAMKWMRDKRGAHTDRDWGDDVPHCFRPFYLMYIGIFLFHVSRYLIGQALKAAEFDTGFSDMVFPDIGRLDEALRIPSSDAGDYHPRLLPGEDLSWSVTLEGEQRPWLLRSTPQPGDERMRLTSYLFFMSAAVDDLSIRTEQGKTTVVLHRAGAPPLVVNDVPSPVPHSQANYWNS